MPRFYARVYTPTLWVARRSSPFPRLVHPATSSLINELVCRLPNVLSRAVDVSPIYYATLAVLTVGVHYAAYALGEVVDTKEMGIKMRVDGNPTSLVDVGYGRCTITLLHIHLSKAVREGLCLIKLRGDDPITRRVDIAPCAVTSSNWRQPFREATGILELRHYYKLAGRVNVTVAAASITAASPWLIYNLSCNHCPSCRRLYWRKALVKVACIIKLRLDDKPPDLVNVAGLPTNCYRCETVMEIRGIPKLGLNRDASRRVYVSKLTIDIHGCQPI